MHCLARENVNKLTFPLVGIMEVFVLFTPICEISVFVNPVLEATPQLFYF